MQKTTERIVPTSAWATGAGFLAGVALPTSGIITEIRLRAHMTAALTATAVADAARRSIDGWQIQANNRNLFGLSGNINLGILQSLLNLYDHHTVGLENSADVGGAITYDQSYTFHPGSFPGNRFDTSVVIPARKWVGNLQSSVSAPLANVVDSAGAGIAAGVYSLEVDHIKEMAISRRMFTPAGFCQIIHPVANNAAFPGISINVPVGFRLRRIVILALDQTLVTQMRLDTMITGVQLTVPKESRVVMESNWLDLKYASARRYGVSGISGETALGALVTTRPGIGNAVYGFLPQGFAIIDLRDYVDPSRVPDGPLFGLDLIGYTPGDILLNFTNAAFNVLQSFCIYWDLLAPMEESLVEVP